MGNYDEGTEYDKSHRLNRNEKKGQKMFQRINAQKTVGINAETATKKNINLKVGKLKIN